MTRKRILVIASVSLAFSLGFTWYVLSTLDAGNDSPIILNEADQAS